MSGLRSSFSMPRGKRKTIGATVNSKGRESDFPVAEGHFATPEVRLHVADDGFARQMPQRNSHVPQVPHASTASSVATADSLAHAFEGGGQHIYGMQNTSRDILMSKASLSKAPAPCPTLRARLSKKSQEAIRSPDKVNMESVDKTPVHFRRRYSGAPGESWVDHLDKLEVQMANKHLWSAREYYYALQLTLVGKARATLMALEEGTETPDLPQLLPDWFDCPMTEIRQMIKGTVSFSQLAPNTKVAILISLFHERYQRITPDRAMEDFKFSTQRSDQSLEEWGVEIERLKNRVEKFGKSITWEMYIKKWRTGTRDSYFVGRLTNAMVPTDNRSPVVIDLHTFKQWYNRYLAQQRERQKDREEHARLVILERFRQSSLKSPTRSTSQARNNRAQQPTTRRLYDHRARGPNANTGQLRRGPAPPVTVNQHSSLFRQPGKGGSPTQPKNTDQKRSPLGNMSGGQKHYETRKCYNCNKVGHIAKDCPHPKRPRQMRLTRKRNHWRDRLSGAIAELMLNSGEEESVDMGMELDQQIEAMVSTLSLSEDEEEEAPGGQHDDVEEPHQELSAAEHMEHVDEIQAQQAALATLPSDQPTEYSYANFHINEMTGMHSAIGLDDPIADQLRDQFLPAEDCLWHQWPAEFDILQRHVARGLQPIIHKTRLREGYHNSPLSTEAIEWIVLQSAWLCLYTGRTVTQVFVDLLSVAHAAMDQSLSLEQQLKSRVVACYQEPAEEQRISALMLYPEMSKILQSMLQDSFAVEVLDQYHPEARGSTPKAFASGEDILSPVEKLEKELQQAIRDRRFDRAHQLQNEIQDRTVAVPEDSQVSSALSSSPAAKSESRPRFVLLSVRGVPLDEVRYVIWVGHEVYTKLEVGVEVIRGFYQLHSAINHLFQMHASMGTEAWDNVRNNVCIYDPDKQLTVPEMSGYVVYRQSGLQYTEWIRSLSSSPGISGGTPSVLKRTTAVDPPAAGGPAGSVTTTSPISTKAGEVEGNTGASLPISGEGLEAPMEIEPTTMGTVGGTESGPGGSETGDSTPEKALPGGVSPLSKVGLQSPSRSTPVRVDTSLAPLRIYRVEATDPDNAARSLQVIKSIVHRVLALGTHVLMAVKTTAAGKGCSTWFVDTGFSITQFTPKEAEKYRKSLVLVGPAIAICQAATRRLDIPMVLYKLKGLSVVDPRTGRRSKPIDTYAFVNPMLTIHGVVMGLNTVRDLQLSFDVSRKLVFVGRTSTFPMMEQSDAGIWQMEADAENESGPSPSRDSSTPNRSASASSSHRVQETPTPQRRREPTDSAMAPDLERDPSIGGERGGDRSSRKRRFWAVAVGWRPGIYQNLAQYRLAFEKFTSAKHKGFKTRREAEQYMLDMGVPTHLWKGAPSVQTSQKGLKADREVPSSTDGNESSRTPLVTERYRRDLAKERDLQKATRDARLQAQNQKSWAIRRFEAHLGHPGRENNQYTPEDRAEVRAAVRAAARDTAEEEALIRRVSLVGIGSPGSTPSTPPRYHPTNRLVRLADQDQSPEPSEDSVLGFSASARAVPLTSSLGDIPDAGLEEIRALFQSSDSDTEPVDRRSRELTSAVAGPDVEGLSPIEAVAVPIPVAVPCPDHSAHSASTMYGYTEQLFNSPEINGGPGHEAGEDSWSVYSAPAKLRIFVSKDGMRVALSRMQLAIRTASDLGSYMPISFGDFATIALYDSGASISQATPEMIALLMPFLREVAQDSVEFVSVETKTKVSMKLYICDFTSLIQVESGLRSAPLPTYLVMNPRLKTFPVLLGLLTMSELNLFTGHREGIVRDGDGRPFRLYNARALPKLQQSLRILSAKWELERVQQTQREVTPMGTVEPITASREGPARERESTACWFISPSAVGKQGSFHTAWRYRRSIGSRKGGKPCYTCHRRGGSSFVWPRDSAEVSSPTRLLDHHREG